MTNGSNHRFEVLDGWRGISILLVLATHLLPLGPSYLKLNSTAGPMGMSLFFTLSGFLITNFLIHKDSVLDFLIRRFFRIIPLTWLYVCCVLLVIMTSDLDIWLSHLFFTTNIPPMTLTQPTSHLWSLAVEMQFYTSIALLVLLLGKKGLLLIPILCVLITLNRFIDDILISINTIYRIDEILAGCTISLIYNNKIFAKLNYIKVNHLAYFVLGSLFIISCHPSSGFMNYFRPYLAASLVFISLHDSKTFFYKVLCDKKLAYVGAISFALYVFHGGLMYTWLGSGETFEKYLKRPLLFLVTFLLAHVSTFYYENWCIDKGKELSKSVRKRLNKHK